MHNRGLVLSMLVAAFIAGPALAEEVIHFTNGSTLAVRSHEYEDDMIKVDLGDNGFMAFPKSYVEKIESAPGVVLQPSTSANQMFTPKPDNRVYAATPRQAHSTPWALPGTDPKSQPNQAHSGLPTVQAFPDHPHPGVQKLQKVSTSGYRIAGESGMSQRNSPSRNRRDAPPQTKVMPDGRARLPKNLTSAGMK